MQGLGTDKVRMGKGGSDMWFIADSQGTHLRRKPNPHIGLGKILGSNGRVAQGEHVSGQGASVSLSVPKLLLLGDLGLRQSGQHQLVFKTHDPLIGRQAPTELSQPSYAGINRAMRS